MYSWQLAKIVLKVPVYPLSNSRQCSESLFKIEIAFTYHQTYPFRIHNPVVFCVFTKLSSHHHYSSHSTFITFPPPYPCIIKQNPVSISSHSPFYFSHSPSPCNQEPTFCPYGQTTSKLRVACVIPDGITFCVTKGTGDAAFYPSTPLCLLGFLPGCRYPFCQF